MARCSYSNLSCPGIKYTCILRDWPVTEPGSALQCLGLQVQEEEESREE